MRRFVCRISHYHEKGKNFDRYYSWALAKLARRGNGTTWSCFRAQQGQQGRAARSFVLWMENVVSPALSHARRMNAFSALTRSAREAPSFSRPITKRLFGPSGGFHSNLTDLDCRSAGSQISLQAGHRSPPHGRFRSSAHRVDTRTSRNAPHSEQRSAHRGR